MEELGRDTVIGGNERGKFCNFLNRVQGSSKPSVME